jgi:hypothetical protein
MNKRLKHILLAAFGACLMFSTIILPMCIDKKNDAKKLSFGYPFAFVSQDFYEDYKDYNIYPWYQKFEIKRPISHFSIINAIASFAVFFLGIEAVIYVLEFFKGKLVDFWEKRKNLKSEKATSR